MAHLKPLEAFHRGLAGVHVIDLRARRPIAHPLEQLLDRGFLAFDVRLDRAVGRVADPAGDAEAARLILGPHAVEHALDLARDLDPACDATHQTVEMSGASSAFMPTTL